MRISFRFSVSHLELQHDYDSQSSKFWYCTRYTGASKDERHIAEIFERDKNEQPVDQNKKSTLEGQKALPNDITASFLRNKGEYAMGPKSSQKVLYNASKQTVDET